MSRFYDEDGIDGPWEKAMSRPISARDLIELADQERKRRMESPEFCIHHGTYACPYRHLEAEACKRCGHDRKLHPWTATHHTGCDERNCRCPGYED